MKDVIKREILNICILKKEQNLRFSAWKLWHKEAIYSLFAEVLLALGFVFFSEIQKTKSEASWLIRAKSLMLKLQLECHKELMCRKRGKSMKEETIIKTRTA